MLGIINDNNLEMMTEEFQSFDGPHSKRAGITAILVILPEISFDKITNNTLKGNYDYRSIH